MVNSDRLLKLREEAPGDVHTFVKILNWHANNEDTILGIYKFYEEAYAHVPELTQCYEYMRETVGSHDNLNEPCSCPVCSFWWREIEQHQPKRKNND